MRDAMSLYTKNKKTPLSETKNTCSSGPTTANLHRLLAHTCRVRGQIANIPSSWAWDSASSKSGNCRTYRQMKVI